VNKNKKQKTTMSEIEMCMQRIKTLESTEDCYRAALKKTKWKNKKLKREIDKLKQKIQRQLLDGYNPEGFDLNSTIPNKQYVADYKNDPGRCVAYPDDSDEEIFKALMKAKNHYIKMNKK
jgi:hypothetical protein